MSRKILIIDDEPEVIFVLKARLKKEGYEVLSAEDGTEGLEKFKAEKPGLIITDVMMPGMTGYEFFNALRKLDQDSASVPVIVFSARGGMSQFFDRWSIRCFIPKPVDMPLLVEEVKKAFEEQNVLHAVSEKKALLQKKGEERVVLIVGVSEYEMRKAKETLEQHGCVVLQGLDEKDAFETAHNIKPDFLLIEYWEDTARFDAVQLFHDLGSDSITRQIPYVVFCRRALENDARKYFNAQHLICFNHVADFMNAIESLIQTPAFQKRNY